MPIPLRVLLVAELEDDAVVLAHELRRGGYDPGVCRVDSPAGMSEALGEGPWDIVLADVRLEQLSALAALMLLMNQGLDIPFLVVSGAADERDAATLMRAGAHDYIRKSAFARLVPAVERELRQAAQRRDHKLAEEALRRRGEYLTCLAEISAELLAAGDLDFTLPRVLRQLRAVSGADRCYLFSNQIDAAGDVVATQRFEDCAQGVDSRLSSASGSTLAYAAAGFARWVSVLSHGGAICGAVAEFPDSERAFFEPQGVLWVVALPLRMAGEWCGFIGFDACQAGLRWTNEEISVLRTAASAIAAAIRRLRVEEKLRESEARYRTLAENTYDLICETDRHGAFLYASPNYRDVLGYEPGELCGRTYLELIHPDDAADVAKRIGSAADAAAPGQATFRYRHQRGDWRWFESTSKAFQSASGDSRVVTVSRDITARKWAEERIERLNRVVRAIQDVDRLITREKDRQRLLSQACDILVRVGDYGLVWIGLVDVDEKDLVPVACAGCEVGEFARLLGGSAAVHDLARLAVQTGRPSIHRESGGHTGRDNNGNGTAYRSKVVVPLCSGERCYGVMSVSTSRTEAFDEEEVELLGEVAGDIAFALAVIDMNAELQTYHNHLEDLVQERTTELAAANRELEAFCYSVSHDLRAPLRSIDGFSQLLLEDYADRLDADGRENLQRVRAGSQRMAHLIDDLLELSRLTRSELRREPVDLSAMVAAIESELRQAEPDRQVTVRVAAGVVDSADPRLLRAVLENLLGNAWKFTGKHAQALVEFGVLRDGGEDVYFVRDDGAGFDMAYADKLFGAFQRLHGASEFEGSGIGLATVQRVIQRHGGRIWAEGSVEQGATFYFTLQGRTAACAEDEEIPLRHRHAELPHAEFVDVGDGRVVAEAMQEIDLGKW